MDPRQIFLPIKDHPDGYIAVVCHRPDKDLEILKAQGWVEEAPQQELDIPTFVEEEKPKKKAKKDEAKEEPEIEADTGAD